MNARLIALALTLSLTSVAPLMLGEGAFNAPLKAGELHALQAADTGSLDHLRAGLLEAPSSIETGERAALLAAAQQDTELEALRGGDLHLTDREIKLMLIAGGVVLVIALLA